MFLERFVPELEFCTLPDKSLHVEEFFTLSNSNLGELIGENHLVIDGDPDFKVFFFLGVEESCLRFEAEEIVIISTPRNLKGNLL